MIKSETLIKIGMYNENFYYAQDYKLFKDLIENKHKIKIIKKVLYEINMTDNISMKNKNEQAYFADCVRRNIIPIN